MNKDTVISALQKLIDALQAESINDRYEIRYWDSANPGHPIRPIIPDAERSTMDLAIVLAVIKINSKYWKRIEILDTKNNKVVFDYDGTMNDE